MAGASNGVLGGVNINNSNGRLVSGVARDRCTATDEVNDDGFAGSRSGIFLRQTMALTRFFWELFEP
uniref:Uncharacterized protein n=1 Tax=Leersia perrieri TaxID=77586 RepID=A0A0D9W7U3_9ORYZ